MFHAPFSTVDGFMLGCLLERPSASAEIKKARLATDSPRAQYVSLSRVSCVSGGRAEAKIR